MIKKKMKLCIWAVFGDLKSPNVSLTVHFDVFMPFINSKLQKTPDLFFNFITSLLFRYSVLILLIPKNLSVCDVFFEVAVGRAALSVLRAVGQAFPAGVFLASHAVWAAQLGHPLGWRPLFAVVARVGPFRGRLVKVVPQVFQIQRPGAKLLPVDPLEGHDAVQVSTYLRMKKPFSYSPSQTHKHLKQRVWELEPFWFCDAESPSLCGECPGILDFGCWGQSRYPATCRENFLLNCLTAADVEME